jgi:hypothetical protein
MFASTSDGRTKTVTVPTLVRLYQVTALVELDPTTIRLATRLRPRLVDRPGG